MSQLDDNNRLEKEKKSLENKIRLECNIDKIELGDLNKLLKTDSKKDEEHLVNNLMQVYDRNWEYIIQIENYRAKVVAFYFTVLSAVLSFAAAFGTYENKILFTWLFVLIGLSGIGILGYIYKTKKGSDLYRKDNNIILFRVLGTRLFSWFGNAKNSESSTEPRSKKGRFRTIHWFYITLSLLIGLALFAAVYFWRMNDNTMEVKKDKSTNNISIELHNSK